MLINIQAAKQQLKLKTDEREFYILCKNMCTCIDLVACVMLLHISFVKSKHYACWHCSASDLILLQNKITPHTIDPRKVILAEASDIVLELAQSRAPGLFSSQQPAERTAEQRMARWKQHTQDYPGTTLVIGPNATLENLNLFDLSKGAGIKIPDRPISVIFNPQNCELIQVKAGVAPKLVSLNKYLNHLPQTPVIHM